MPTSALPKHAWMLNGSYARRADEPQRQIGVTLEQASAQPVVAADRGASGRAGHGIDRAAGQRRHRLSRGATRAPGTGSATTRAMPFTRSSKESRMDQRRPAPGAGDPAVMAEYFETMRQFLETQERVMAAYMTGDAAGIARALPRPRSAHGAAAAYADGSLRP